MDLTNKNLSIERATKHVHKHGYKFPVEKRIEVVTKWLALGNMRQVADLTGVSYQLCREWKMEPWWAEIVDEVKASRGHTLNTKLSKIVDRSLDMITDRLKNGDFVFNQKTGEVIRKEVSLKDATKVATDLLTRQAILQKQEAEETTQQTAGTIKDQLAMLALEFSKFNKRTTGPVEDIKFVETTDDALPDQRETRLQEGEREVQLEASSEEEEGSEECSSSDDDAEGVSLERGW